MEEINETKKRVVMMSGTVVSDKMNKTAVVKVQRTYKHPLLGKTIRSFKKYKVHDEGNIAKVGDVVKFFEGRPVSKTKYMYLESVVGRDTKADLDKLG